MGYEILILLLLSIVSSHWFGNW